METPPPISNVPPALPRSWWSQNWKWFVPTGCLSIIVLSVAFLVGVFFLASGMMKSSDVYRTALARAKSNPAVIEALGEPLQEGLLVTGKTEVTGGSGAADIGIPITGPKGKGTIYAVATKSAGRWTYRALEVEVNGREDRINLLQGEPVEE